MPQAKRSAWQKLRINALYARGLLKSARPALLVTIAFFVIGSLVIAHWYQGGTPAHVAMQIMYFLMLGEPTYDTPPDHPIVEAIVVLAPLVGIIVVFDLITRFSLHVFGRKTNQREWVTVVASTYKNHIILCGLGRVGRKVFRELVELGEHVVCIEQNEDAVGVRLARQTDHPVIIDDARLDHVLKQAGVERAKAVLAVTDEDMVNLEIALDARKSNDAIRIIARIHDEKLGRKLTRGLTIDGVYSTTSLAAPFFAVAGLDRQIVNSFFIGDTRFVIVETDVIAGDWLDGSTVAAALDGHGISLLRCERGGMQHAFCSTTRLQAGDHVCFQCTYDTFRYWRASRTEGS
ncbi:MAG: NAD(P)-binding protein [bacterium]|nr:NAD-binding protein [Myxococcales bacterium]MCB9554066.1 NAD-binding protein [Myxococcales bacterium]